MSEDKPSQITGDHFTDFAEIANRETCVNVYGRPLQNTEFPADSAGMPSFNNPSGRLQLAYLVGYSEKGTCFL
jgi:hypothetical protein